MTDQNQQAQDDLENKGAKPDEEAIEIVETQQKDDDRISVQAQAATQGAVQETDDAQMTDEERERVRAERRAKKERRKRAMERDKTELRFLRDMNDRLERRLIALEADTVENRIATVQSRAAQIRGQIKLADDLKKKALDADNSEDVVYADNAKAELQAELARIEGIEGQLREVHQERVKQAKQPKKPEVDPTIVDFAKDFYKKNPWCDPAGGDEDSAIVFAIDTALVNEGYRPHTEGYWRELQKRVEKRLPHHFNGQQQQADEDDDDDDDDDDPPQRQQAAGRGQQQESTQRRSPGPRLPNGAPAGNGKAFYLSPERKQALIDLGVWEDPVLRNRYVKKYMEYDRERAKQA